MKIPSLHHLQSRHYYFFFVAILYTFTHTFIHALSVPARSSSTSSSSNNDASSFRQLKISFVTGNAMKAREMERILAEHEATQRKNGVEKKTTNTKHDDDDDDSYYKPQSLVDLRVLTVDLPEIQEVDTIAIAKDKVILASQLAGGPCVVEDTSLKFTALGGMPGPYIKWFQDRLKCDGLYNILQAYDDKSATACCTLAFCPAPHADPVLFTGECHGTIVAPVEGRGFGWDSIFVPDSSIDGRPFSIMTVEEKNECSHRGKAVRKWAMWLGKNHDALLERQESNTSSFLPGHKGLDFKVDFPEQ